jgi:hypothetical protein
MAIDPLLILLVALVAIVVAATAARRSAEHADRLAGRRPVPARRGPLGAVVDLLDESLVVYGIRQRLGLSTRNRVERRTDEARAALITRADEIRQHRTGASPVRPTHLVVAGRADVARPSAAGRGPAKPSSTLPLELLAAVFGFVVVVGIVVAIWPRGDGSVLSATGTPAPSIVSASPPPSPSPSVSPAPP